MNNQNPYKRKKKVWDDAKAGHFRRNGKKKLDKNGISTLRSQKPKKGIFFKSRILLYKNSFLNKMFFFFLTQLRIELCASIAERENK